MRCVDRYIVYITLGSSVAMLIITDHPMVAVDDILQVRSVADAEYSGQTCGRTLSADALVAVKDGVLAARPMVRAA